MDREIDYYEKQSRQLTTRITILGTILALVMGISAVLGAKKRADEHRSHWLQHAMQGRPGSGRR